MTNDVTEYLDASQLPRFQERLDLTATDMDDLKEVLRKAINELAGRFYIINNLVTENTSAYATNTSYPIVDKYYELVAAINTLNIKVNTILEKIEDLDDTDEDFNERLNALDEAAALKVDLNVLYQRVNTIVDGDEVGF